MSLTCKNLKVSFVCKYDVDVRLVQHKHAISKHRISNTFRQQELSCVFTIYNHSLRTLHCTGIKEIHSIEKIIEFIEYVLKNEVLSSRIDNSLFTCKQSSSLLLSDVIDKVGLLKDPIYYCTHASEIIPGLFLKPVFKRTGFPSVILFHNSSYVLIGGKSIRKVKAANLFVKAICDTVRKKATPVGWKQPAKKLPPPEKEPCTHPSCSVWFLRLYSVWKQNMHRVSVWLWKKRVGISIYQS